MTYGKQPVGENEVVIQVPKGTTQNVRIEEADTDNPNSEIIVRVSKQRKSSSVPMLGVIVK